MPETKEIKAAVKSAYASLANSRTKPLDTGCCEPATKEKLLRYGYTEEELESLPESVVSMSDGCGNPTGIGVIREGEVVLDLGSGGGIDIFLASRRVGQHGRVIGLDMTPEMVQKARANAQKANLHNVEFKLGEIEDLPLDDRSVDVIISNCVICLSPDKGTVFREMFRVLKPGGRLAIVDETSMTLSIRYVDGSSRADRRLPSRMDWSRLDGTWRSKAPSRYQGSWNTSPFMSGTCNALKSLCADSAAAPS